MPLLFFAAPAVGAALEVLVVGMVDGILAVPAAEAIRALSD